MLERNGKKVCVMGLGYIGLPTAAILASRGYDVHGVDVRADVVETINRGEIHIHEPRLAELVKEVVDGGNLHASIEPCEADVFFICVPTPSNSDKSPDLSYVRAASEAIRPYVRRGNIIILESTSPPKTTEETVVPLAVANEFEVGRDVFVAYCPERVLPGRILIEAVENDRIVGGITPACTQHVQQFYETFVTGNVLATTAITAEITKLTENAFRDVNIAFANELSMLADHLGADAFEIIELANRHPRVNILNPGPGVGGHCISVDPWFLAHAAPNQTPLIRAARQVNDHKPHFLVQKIERLVADYRISVVGCLGLAYKADVDDLRESPSLEIVRELKSRLNAEILVCDPYVSPDKFREFSLCPLDEIVQRSELLVLLTDHSQFMTLSSKQLSNKLLIDARGEWHSQDLTAAAQRDVPLATPAASERHAA
ncbi:MAG: UDP-N-acetyl-D-mannosamine dehydrogenase [Planctomycetaceae bacterium]|nr:UDP-N-acetyl-D-mannosamine dehydrogenase [Planctomycetaceae bacterium]